jgi:hypothetical protein
MKKLILTSATVLFLSIAGFAHDGDKYGKKCEKKCDQKECTKDGKCEKKCGKKECTHDANCKKDQESCKAKCKATSQQKEVKPQGVK